MLLSLSPLPSGLALSKARWESTWAALCATPSSSLCVHDAKYSRVTFYVQGFVCFDIACGKRAQTILQMPLALPFNYL